MTAMITAAAIGVAGSAYMQHKSSKAAEKAGKQATEAQDERLDFEREQWQEWQDTYGPIEDSLANYYDTLTPTMRITQGLEAHEKEMDRAKTQVRATLDQRGIGTSGIAAQTETEMAVSSAEERARIRAAAPMEVAKEKLGFLSVGLGMNPQQGMRNALGDVANAAQQDARTTAANAGVATGALVGSVTNFAQTAFTTWMNRPQQPVSGVPTVPGP